MPYHRRTVLRLLAANWSPNVAKSKDVETYEFKCDPTGVGIANLDVKEDAGTYCC